MAFLRNRRVQLVGLLSLPSGLPLGFVTSTLQVFLRSAGVSLKTIGILQVISVPWTLKFLWAPLVDRYALRWPDRRRSWILLMQLAMAGTLGGLAVYVARTLSTGPGGSLVLAGGAAVGIAAIGLAVAFISATQDIAIDAFAVESLSKDEVGPASGLRIMWYRVGMLMGAALAIAASEWIAWPWVFAALAVLFALFTLLTLAAPSPPAEAPPPRNFGEAVVLPFRDFLGRSSAVPVALFLVFYKFGDNLGLSMVNAFLVDLCFSRAEIGFAVKIIGTVATIGGAAAGAALMTRMGLGRALWVFGIAQAASMLLYSLAAATHPGPTSVALCAGQVVSVPTRAATYVAIAGEYATQGMATSALVAFVTRLCNKRFAASQYALLSSLFGLGRWMSGPPSGWLAEWLGYASFFVVAALAAIPGLVLLQRVAPIQQRDLPAGEMPQG